VRVDVEGHGRHQEVVDARLDLTRTVGWFTTVSPVRLPGVGAAGWGERLKQVKEHLRERPGQGLGYGIARYLRRETSVPGLGEVAFNYLGQWDTVLERASWLEVADESSGPAVSRYYRRPHPLEIVAQVAAGELQMAWIYAPELYRAETIERVAEECRAALEGIIAHCQSPEAGGYTPSDFPLVKLSQQEVDDLIADYPKSQDVYPASPAQVGMLFHTLSDPEFQPYFEQCRCSLENIDSGLLKRAWMCVIEQQPILRSGFVWQTSGRVLQVVSSMPEVEWVEVDWRSCSKDVMGLQIQSFLAKDRARGFDPAKPPLLRFALLQTGTYTNELLFSFHHALLDGWSWPILFQDVLTAYRSLESGELPRPSTRRPYRDYIHWLEQQDLRRAEEYWHLQLADTHVRQSWPFGEGEAGAGYGEHVNELSAEESVAIRAFTERHHLTVSTLFQGALALLLARYAGESEAVFGMTVAGRPSALTGAGQMIGMFANTLPVRVALAPGASVLWWLRQIQQRQAEMSDYAYSSLAQIQRWSAAPSGGPLFETLLVVENYPVESGLEERGRSSGFRGMQVMEHTHYPVTVVAGMAGRVRISLIYDGRRSTRDAIRRFSGHFRRVLLDLIADPGRSLDSFDLLTGSERTAVLDQWNEPNESWAQS
jgi:non-ribosomal peptide synthase protein (TIGR01720 family)